MKGRWSKEEHDNFLTGMGIYGKNWDVIMELFVPTRTATQIRTHAQKYFKKMEMGLPFPEEPYETTRNHAISAPAGASQTGVATTSNNLSSSSFLPAVGSTETAAANSAANYINFSEATAGAAYGIPSSGQQVPVTTSSEDMLRGVGGAWSGGGSSSGGAAAGQPLWPAEESMTLDNCPSAYFGYDGESPLRNWPALSFDMDEDNILLAAGIEGGER